MPTINKPKKTPKKRIGDKLYDMRRAIYQTRRWRRLRELKLLDTPLCEICATKDIIRPAVDVHHITSFVSASTQEQCVFLAFDYNNLQSLCKECHQRIHNYHGPSEK